MNNSDKKVLQNHLELVIKLVLETTESLISVIMTGSYARGDWYLESFEREI
jgi:predicted nucleotidyltransferase